MKLIRHMDIERGSAKEVDALQKEKLLAHIDYCRINSPHYRQILKDISIDASASITDIISQLPFTDKAKLEAHNDELLAVSPDKIVDVVMSSGTTGKPTKVMYSEHDLQRLAYNEEKSFLGCGVSERDTALLTCTIDRCFVAGLAYFLGIRNIGAAAIRNGHGSMTSHCEMIKRLNPTVIVGVPTFVKKLGLFMKEAGVDPAATAVSRIIAIGEPIRDSDLALLKVGQDIETIWDARIFSTYASSETITTFCECSAQQGGHLHPDLAIVEIVDGNGASLPHGEIGEVIVTPLDVEGMPLIRFKTGDISFLIDEPCCCGLNSMRLGPVLGRKNQMLKVKGTTVYPQAVFAVLSELNYVSDFYVSVASDENGSDQLTVYVSSNESIAINELEEVLQSRLRVKPRIVVEEEKFLRKRVYQAEVRKPVRFFDMR